jgi:tetratricopeptide (TPR) repeat protein
MISDSQAKKSRRQKEYAAVCLTVVTLALFLPAVTFESTQFDDDGYVFQNPQVNAGVTVAGVKWAFTKIYGGNWHPVTWISHMVDCNIFGLFPGGHHFTNVLLHTADTLLLFLLLLRMTNSTGASFVVAALFGWHPAHVESVAWISERKDVLSTFFFLLTLIMYVRYAAEPQTTGRRKIFYAWSLVLFALGLMSKQMLVTTPFILLLLDYWPLGRIAEFGVRSAELKKEKSEGIAQVSWKRALAEKIPYFALTVAACGVTLLAQGTGAIRTTTDVPLGLRVANSLVSYAKYFGEAFWPSNLSIFYLLPNAAEKAPAVWAALLLVVITCAALLLLRRMPWLSVGWLWFVGALVPVIGLVQIGSQAMADRYTYIPFIGLFIAVVWTFKTILATNTAARSAGVVLAAPVLAGCLLLTHRQLSYWHDDVLLFGHAVEATPGNYFAEFELAAALEKKDRADEAIKHYSACLQLNPLYEPGRFRLGLALLKQGKADEAAFHFSDALKRDPNSEVLHNSLGVALARQGRNADAVTEFKEAMRISPDFLQPYVNCGDALQELGRPAEALTNYYRAQALAPDAPEALDKLARLLATCPDAKLRNSAAALQISQHANDLTQNQDPTFLGTLAAANAASGNFPKAITIAEDARKRANDLHLTIDVLQLERELTAYRQNRPADAAAAP